MAPYALRYPFGLARVTDYAEVFRRYHEEIPLLAEQVVLPCRHPALSQLEGRYQVEDGLPPWWQACVDELTRGGCPCLEPLLRAICREEFRRGSLEQERWKAWQHAACRLSSEEVQQQQMRSTPCRRLAGPGLSRLLAELLPAGRERGRWLDRFVAPGAKELPPHLDLVITAHPAWWLNMANGRNWFSCMGTGQDRDPRLVGNWYDPGVTLAALVVRGSDCWTPGALMARTTLRVVTNDLPTPGEQAGSQVPSELPTQRVAMGRVYHNDLSAACTLLMSLMARFEQHRLPWGCIAGTTTAEYALDGTLGGLAIAREPHEALGIPYWLPAGIERPALEEQVAYLEGAGQASDGSDGTWTAPSMKVHACQRNTSSTPTTISAGDYT